MANQPPPSFRGRHPHQSQRGHKRGRYERDEGPQAYKHPKMDEDYHFQVNERIDRALKRQAHEAARARELDAREERVKVALRSFGITDFGPELDNLDIAAVMARNVAEYERQQRLKAAAAEAATAEGQCVKEESTETKRDGAGSRGSDSVALKAQATEVANAANETAGKEGSAQGLDSISTSVAQQSHKDGAEDQMIKAEFDNLLGPLR